MRTLENAPEPAELAAKRVEWTEQYAEALAAGTTLPRPWSHPAIVAGLAEETHSKCAYCEGVIADVAHPNVEHKVPKSVRPDLVVEWTNLTLACPQCNGAKHNYYDEYAPLLDPYVHPPEEHLAFRGPVVTSVLGSDLGARTIARIKLMRPALVAERMKRLEALHLLLDRWAGSAGSDRQVYADAVNAFVADDQEFSACLREYAESFGCSS